MKKLLTIVMTLLCFVSKAQTKEQLIKLYNKMVHIDRLYEENLRKMMKETGANFKENTPKQDSLCRALEYAHFNAHDEYNAYWFKYHEMKGDLQQKLQELYGTGEQ